MDQPAEEPQPDDSGKSPADVQLSRLGELKGGMARAREMAKKQRIQSPE